MDLKKTLILAGLCIACPGTVMAQVPVNSEGTDVYDDSENTGMTCVSETVSQPLEKADNSDSISALPQSDNSTEFQTGSEFIDSCRWIKAEPGRYDRDWPLHCDHIYQFCYPNHENTDNPPEFTWSQTAYGQLLCHELIDQCTNAGISFENADIKSEIKTEQSLSQTFEQWADRICDSWLHCIHPNKQIKLNAQKMAVYAADGLSALGFETRIKDGQIQIRGNLQVLPSAVVQDNVLLKLQEFYGILRQQQHSAQKNILIRDLNQFFETDNDGIGSFEKWAIWATILPDMLKHAADSANTVEFRKMHESWNSLDYHWHRLHYDIICVRQREHENLEMRFPAGVLLSDDFTNVSIHRDLLCPNKESLYLDQGKSSEDLVYCRSVLVQNDGFNPAEYFQQALNDAHTALLNKDNDSISESMGRLVDGLNGLSNRYGYVASWNDYWEHAPIESWMCQIQTIELMALELQRMIELVRLERTLQQVFGKTTFHQRLQQFSTCKQKLQGSFAGSANRLWSEHHSDYEWIIRHYAPKSIKKLETDLNSWTRRVSKTVALSRRLLASLASWSHGNEKDAARHAFDVTEDRAIIVHPQLNSYHRLLDIILNGTPNQQTLEQYVRVMLLKSPALAYQLLTEAGSLLDKNGRILVVNTVRQYPASLAPTEAARFYVMYTSEFRKILDLKQLSELNKWIERDRARFESQPQRLKRRLQWMSDLISQEDWQGIVQMFSYILTTDDSLSADMRSHFEEITRYAQILADGREEMESPKISWKIESDSDYDLCIQAAVNDVVGLQKARKYLDTARKCLEN